MVGKQTQNESRVPVVKTAQTAAEARGELEIIRSALAEATGITVEEVEAHGSDPEWLKASLLKLRKATKAEKAPPLNPLVIQHYHLVMGELISKEIQRLHDQTGYFVKYLSIRTRRNKGESPIAVDLRFMGRVDKDWKPIVQESAAPESATPESTEGAQTEPDVNDPAKTE